MKLVNKRKPLKSPRISKIPKLHIINVMWGTKYINTFLNLSLPTQLSEGNLKSLSQKPNYTIYTDKIGKNQILSSSIYQELKTCCNIHFKIKKISPTTCPFKTLLKCHKDGIKSASFSRSPVIFLSPDCIFSTGALTYCENAIKKNVRLVAICSTRMSLEKYETIADAKTKKQGKIDWGPQELAVTAIHNLHHRAKCLFLENNKCSSLPSHFYFKLSQNTVLAKAFHLHPLLIWPENYKKYPVNSADGINFLENSCPNIETWDVITNCKEISLFEVSSDEQFQSDTKEELTPMMFKFWMERNISDAHKHFFTHQIILGEEPQGEKTQESIEKILEPLHSLVREAKSIPLEVVQNFLSFSSVMRFYINLIHCIFTGKKKFTIKKLLSHIGYLFKHKTPPVTEADFAKLSKKIK
ncbi:MAG: hypothetical protein HRU43_04485 [Simkaniaceae bacterium]|nr:hypothetical protein [Simkaniaceae bacterium]